MGKVVKREVIVKKEKHIIWYGGPSGHIPLREEKESEKSAKRNTRAVKGDTRSAVTARAVGKQAETDSRDSFSRLPMWGKTYWNNSIDAMDLSPEQRKHFKTIMRKEVKK
ncbi:unnamed protein product [marine sediment metagenome]|uniref:Uncharacterized protein n=1 Tax=marine sediment metagenome TaxID=412755 RepID=X1HVW5_9ZZZZ